MTPRPYQRAGIDRVITALRDGHRTLYVSPTGSGKSFMGSTIVREMNLPTLWLAHRRELVDQARDELAGLGIDASVCMSGRPFYQNRLVTVASVGTAAKRFISGRRLIVIDECHHSAAATFRAILAMYPDAMVVGLTATPFRLDGIGLGDVFNELIVAAYPDELVSSGFLVEPKVFAPPPIAMAGLCVERTGDYSRGKIAARFDKRQITGDVVKTWKEHANGYRTIVFGCSVEHSRHLAEEFVAAGISAEHVDADTSSADRLASIDRFKAGRTTVLCNVELFTEGFNLPAVEAVCIVRPTASLGLHLQMVGRAMRISANKRHPVVLDHAGNFLAHGRVTRRLEYSLTGRPTFVQAGVGLRTCPKCFRMVLSGRAACPECETVFAAVGGGRELPTHADGSLQMYTAEELDAAMRTPEAIAAAKAEAKKSANESLWWKLTALAKKRGFKAGWVSKEYQRQTGEIRPVRDVDWQDPRLAEAEKDLFSAYAELEQPSQRRTVSTRRAIA